MEIDVVAEPRRLRRLEIVDPEMTRDTLEQMFECVSTIP